MVTPAVLIIWASLVHLISAQMNTTTSAPVSTTTSIVQGPTTTIADLLSQSSISTQFSQYWVASQVNTAITAAINSGSQFTLFVPMNSAWNNLSSSDQTTLSSCLTTACPDLSTVMYYHMWTGAHTVSTFQSTAGSTCSTPYGTDSNTFQCRTFANQPTTSAQLHVALTQAGGSWFVNGARIVVADQQAQSFVVHFIDRWLYPIDTGTTATVYLRTAATSAGTSTSLVSQTCTLCSPVFWNLWNTAASSTSFLSYYNWVQSTAASAQSGVTMFIPYAQPLAYQYSINTLATMINAMTASNITALATIAGAHVIPNRVMFLGPWIANGLPAYGCGPVGQSTLTQYVQSCDLVQFNSTTYAIEVTGNGMFTAAFIIYPNIPVENGVVHIVSNVLNYEYGNLWSIVQLHPQLTIFRGYVQQDTTGVVLGYLQSTSNQYTVFVPDDASWSAMATNPWIANNVTYRSTILQLGIIQGSTMTFSALQSTLTPASTVQWSTIAGVAGNRLRFTSNLISNGIEVNGGLTASGFSQTILSQPDLGATNGIMHIVTGSAFGVPSMTIAQFLLSRPDLTTSAMYFGQMTQAWSLFSNTGNPLTVIVPTNNAWNVLSQNSQLSVIVRSGSSALLYNLLLRHYAAANTQLYGNLLTTSASTTMSTLNGQITFTVVTTSPLQFQASYSSASVTASVNASDYNCTNGRVHIINTVLAVTADAYNLNAGYSCQNPYTCSASAALVNGFLLLLGVLFGVLGRR